MATISSSEAFERLLDRLFYGGLDERDKGDKFERLMKSYLLTDPEWASQFSEVWLWNDYPGRAGRPDIGIDLVAQATDTGELTAIQCKFISPETVVSKRQIDSFLAASSREEFARRLFVSTSVKNWNRNVEQTVQGLNPPLTRLNFHDLASAPIDWTQFSLDTPEQLVREGGAKTLRKHQRDALEAVSKGFETHDRGKMIMACGTGKTFTSLQVMEDQTSEDATILFLVPSIALLSQTLREWKYDASEDFRALAVCSDVKVGKNREEDISTTDLIIPATTDPQRLLDSQRLAQDYKGRTIVFSTYQSIEVIAEAQKQGFPDFDLIICDEAHRTTGAKLAGKDESAFMRVHDNDFVRGSKRLYMTATPRVFDEKAKAKADENSVVIASMDNTDLYGTEFYRLGFGEAVEKDLLADYKVLVLAVDETSVNEQLQNLLTDEEGELSIDDVARLVGCWNGLATRGSNHGENQSVQGVKPMQRAVAFASNIKESQRVAKTFPSVTEQLAENSQHNLVADVDHVDGGMNVSLRNQKLSWLKEEPEPGTCRILANARCLSEGVDVPSLDAVLFLNPRNSQVDVVQSVGRVMRKAPGKDYGYIILPVGIPTGMTPEQALKDSKRYKVIWSVLNALRSHDDRFEAMVNKIDLNERRNDKLQIIGVGTGSDDDDSSQLTTGRQQAFDFDFDGIEQWRDAIYAKIVQKVGDREYWENWSKTIADVAGRHTDRIRALVTQDPTEEIKVAFANYTKALKANLNEGIAAEDAISMLSQHLITKPVFDALFEGYDFAENNPVSQVMDAMVQTLEGNNLSRETEELNDFYASVARRASGVENPDGKQRIINELYENFFKKAFPTQAKALAVVYTPIEVVDFMIRSVDNLSREHFGAGLTDRNVHILDPFTGTGTFIVRLLQSGVIEPHDLARKLASELHANEIMLLAYYIAAINIEATFHGVKGGDYQPFNGIVLADTFQMSEEDGTLDTTMFTANSERAVNQLDTDIRIIIGNPPYHSGRKSANDNHARQSYPQLDAKIRNTYAKDTTAQLRRYLYDSYVRAIRWGTDRIGDQGILAYVTNGGYIDSNSMNGLRQHLTEDFDYLYIYNLRGNQRTGGELSRKEGGKIFDSGSRASVAVMFCVKDPNHTGKSVLKYREMDDYLSRDQKLATIQESDISDDAWELISPSVNHEWINHSTQDFQNYVTLGDRTKIPAQTPIFASFSSGLATARDPWVYNFSYGSLRTNVTAMTKTYNEATRKYSDETRAKRDEKDVASWLEENRDYADEAKLAWSRKLRTRAASDKQLQQEPDAYRIGLYRPFTKHHIYFDDAYNEGRSKLPTMFPTTNHVNYGFYVVGKGSAVPFSVLATDLIPNAHVTGAGSGGHFFSRYTYKPLNNRDALALPSLEDDVHNGYLREDNITDDTHMRYKAAFGDSVTKDQIFSSIYALLHSKQYRSSFAADLKRELPRLPLPDNKADFASFADAGNELLQLHIAYESVEQYELQEQHSSASEDGPDYYRLDSLKWEGTARNPDRSSLIYNSNVKLLGIPDEAHEYMIGTRSALEWLVDRYKVDIDDDSRIMNDPNDWIFESGNPRYVVDLIKRVVTLSIKTVGIVNKLPRISDL